MLEETLIMDTLGSDALLGVFLGAVIFLIYVVITEKIK
jgi:hypothetical protein